MPYIYTYELSAYRAALKRIQAEDCYAGENLTHFALGQSNRLNFMLVGLFGLAEAACYDVVKQAGQLPTPGESGQLPKIEDIKQPLFKVAGIDSKKFSAWSQLKDLGKVRNAIVHGYGGLVLAEQSICVRDALTRLKMSESLICDTRIRLTADNLHAAIDIIEELINTID